MFSELEHWVYTLAHILPPYPYTTDPSDWHIDVLELQDNPTRLRFADGDGRPTPPMSAYSLGRCYGEDLLRKWLGMNLPLPEPVQDIRAPVCGKHRVWMRRCDQDAATVEAAGDGQASAVFPARPFPKSSPMPIPIGRSSAPAVYPALPLPSDPVLVRATPLLNHAVLSSAVEVLRMERDLPPDWLDISCPASATAVYGRRLPPFSEPPGPFPALYRGAPARKCEALDQLFGWPWPRRFFVINAALHLVMRLFSWPASIPDIEELADEAFQVRHLLDHAYIGTSRRRSSLTWTCGGLLEGPFVKITSRVDLKFPLHLENDRVPMGLDWDLVWAIVLGRRFHERRMEVARQLEPWLREYVLGFEAAPQVMASRWWLGNLFQLLMIELSEPRPECAEAKSEYLDWLQKALQWYGLSAESARVLTTFGQLLAPLRIDEPHLPDRLLWVRSHVTSASRGQMSVNGLLSLAAQRDFVVAGHVTEA